MMALKHKIHSTITLLGFILIGSILSSCEILPDGYEVPPGATSSAESAAEPTITFASAQPEPSPTLTIRDFPTIEAGESTSGPTSTPIQLPTYIKPSDAEVPLTYEGPWLMYCTEGGRGKWTITNADGTGRAMIGDNYYHYNPVIFPSHHSNFVAYHFSDWDGTINKISIIRLPTMETLRVINTISYPGLLDSDEYNEELGGIRYALFDDPRWSPDGRYLAFVGAIEGPSSDLYVYDTLTDQVRRLTSGPNHAISPNWSPDSRWIVHREVDAFGADVGDVATWASTVDGSQNKRLYEPTHNVVLGWLSPSVFISIDNLTGLARDIRLVDLAREQVTILFDGIFDFYGYDRNNGTIFFIPTGSNEDGIRYPDELYKVSPENPTLEKAYPGRVLLEWDEWLQRFVSEDLPCEEGFIGTLTSSGDLECVERFFSEADLSWSPDRKWAIDKATGQTLYNAAGEVVRQFTSLGATDIVWRPDSQGVFLYSDHYLFYLQVSDGDLMLVDDRSPTYVSWV
jgi:hypothetical protein